jgi:autotransporter-associated beta strand protein
VNNGTLITNTNNANLVLGNQISGSGNFIQTRNTVYLTADNTYTGTTTIGSTGQNASVRVGNDTYTGSVGTGAIIVQSSTGGNSSIRYHLNQDYTIANTVTLLPNSDGTTARNADFVKEGLGTMVFTGTMIGGNRSTPAPGTQRSLITVAAGGAFVFAGTMDDAVNREVNITNNAVVKIAGSANNTFNGVLSGNNIWIFDNSGTTTLLGVNTFNTANAYIRNGTLVVGTGGVDTIQNDNDMHLLRGATLSVAGNETVGLLHLQRGAVVNIASGATLTVDDAAAQMVAGSIQGSGNLTLAGGNYMAMYGTNTATGALSVTNGTLQFKNVTDAIGSFSSVTLGGGATAGRLEYIGSGETFTGNITLAGTGAATTAVGSNRITANGNGALILSGNITATATNTLQLTGQTGGYFNPIRNQITGAITQGSNVLSIAMPNVGEDDRYGITGRWALTNSNNNFSGAVIVNVGMLEFMGDLGVGTGTTSVAGNLSVPRTFTLGSNNFNGRRYDMFGSGDQLGDAGYSQGTNTLTPAGSVGTIIFNDPNAGVANLSNITWAMPNITTTNTSGMQFINDGVKQVNLYNAFAFGTTGARVVALDGSNTLSNTILGAIGNPTSSQATRVDKEGAGTWRLAGTNTYAGATTILNGVLEIAGGAAIVDGGTVAVSGAGADGLFSGTAKLRVINSETIGLLTSNILTETEILSGQTLTIGAAGTNTVNGLITGAGNLVRTTSAGAALMNASASNTYTGITTLQATGTATGNTTFAVWQLANGGSASGIGQSSNAASNLVFGSNTAGTFGGVLQWQGFNNQSTDRLFTMGLGAAGARINATGTLVGLTVPTLTFSNTGAIAFAGSGARTLTLGGTTISDNVFRPQIINDGANAVSLIKTDAGMWVLNPDAAGNTFTGGTTITGGTLAILAGNALGSGAITINAGFGSGLQIRNGITLSNNIVNSTADGGIQATSGNSVLAGTVALNAQARIAVDSGASMTFGNVVSGSGNLFKAGEGTLVLNATNTHTGQTWVAGGTLRLDYATNNTTKLADAAQLQLGMQLSGGFTTLGSDANVFGQNNAFGMTGGTIELAGGSHTEVVLSTQLNNGANRVIRTSGTSVLQMGTITRNVAAGIAAGNGLLDYGTINLGGNGIATVNNTNIGSGANAILAGWATVGLADWAVNATNAANGSINALAAAGYNNNTGLTTFGSGFNTDVLIDTTLTGITTAQSLRFNQAGSITLNLGGSSLSLESGGILLTPGSGNVTISNGTLNRSATTVGLDTVFHVNGSASQTLTVNAVIANNTGAQAITKTGSGTLILNAANTFTNRINLQQGTLQIGDGTAGSADARIGQGGGTNNQVTMAEGTVLRFNVANPTAAAFNTQVISGGGLIEFAPTNTATLLFDDDLTNFFGDINFSGGTLQIANTNALGNIRGLLNVNNSVNMQFNAANTLTKVTNYSQGTTFNLLNNVATSTGTFAGTQFFNNTTNGGLVFNIPAPTVSTTVGLNITGVIFGNSGFTKTGNGILQLSANNFGGVYDGFTGANANPTLLGKIAVNGGILYVGGVRALGAHGVGNEVVVASGASVDLRGQSLNYGDDSSATRKIFEISGTGFNGTGALRNSTSTGQISFLKLNDNALINSGGSLNGSALNIAGFDTNLANGTSLTGGFTRNRPVIDGNNKVLTVTGSRLASDNIVITDPSFASPLAELVIAGSSVAMRHEISASLPRLGISSADITNGITLAYAGPSLGDLTNASLGHGANTGARLRFDNYYGTSHTVGITMDGVTAAANNGYNTLEVQFFTIPQGSTFLNGGITLLGDASRNILNSGTTGNYSVVEQGNTLVAPVGKMIIGGVMSGAGGFTKLGFAETRLTNLNTFAGDVNVLRFGSTSSPWQSNLVKINGVDYQTQGNAEGWAEWGLTLNGPDGAIAGTSNINLQRRGMITLDNTNRLDLTSGVVGGNNNNRINDTAVLNMSNGWLRINGGTVNNTEVLGTVNVGVGTNIIDLYPTNGAGTNMTLTLNNLNRAAGGTLRFSNLDATATFGTGAAGESVRVALGATSITAIGGAGGIGSTTRSILPGVFGGTIPLGLDTELRILGFNNGNVTDLWNQQRNLQFLAGSHFMTMDGGFLRPLDDSEYFTPTNGLINPLIGANQNVNLTDIFTVMSQDTTINALRFGPAQDHNGSGGTVHAETSLTTLTDHAAIQFIVDGTLRINSGMISSAYFTAGNTSSLATIIMGGTLDFNGQEAIINNQNGLYRLTDGLITTGNLEIRSNITNANGLTKTGQAQVVLDGANTYTGLTTIHDGTLLARHGRSALGAGGAGNGVVITGNGSLNSGNGIRIGSPTAREDIFVGILNGDNQVMRVDNDVTQWYSNLIIDNVDLSGMPLFTPRVRADASATSIIMGNIYGGPTAVTNDVLMIDSRRVSFDAAGNNTFIFNGQFGDRGDANGNALPVANPVSLLPTLAGVRTNENEVLRVNLTGASLETNFIMNRQYNAAGRLNIERGVMIVNYDPAAAGNDGAGFWTDTAISRIPNADSVTTAFAVNGGTSQQGFVMNPGGGGVADNNGVGGLFLARPGQIFNMATWTMGGTGAKFIGGLNQSGTVTFGDGTGTLTVAGAIPQFYAADGGTVVFNQRITGNVGTAPSGFGILKAGRGTMELRNSSAGAGDSNFVLAGGTLILNHTAATSVALVGNLNARFDGGSLISIASSGAATTEAFATSDAADRVLNFNIGGTEIVARTANTGTARNMTINMGNANANATTSNFLRNAGVSANLVEDNLVGGTAAITLNFNASSTAAARDAAIPWMTYGTLSRTATDFAMIATSGNNVNSFGTIRAIGDLNNNVATWTASGQISESGGVGFGGALAGALSIGTLRFDTATESIVNLGTNVLTVAAPALAQSAGAILVSSNTGSANKTITGTGAASLTTTGGRNELIIHQFGLGNLNLNVPITGTGTSLVIAGPSTVNASTIGTTGAVVLGVANSYTGRTYLNGAVLSFNAAAQLGANPGAATTDQIQFSGGTLRYTGTGYADLGNRGVLINGASGAIDVTDGAAELRVRTIANLASTNYRGDIVKVGAGTLTLEGIATNNAAFTGLLDIRQGTLRLNGDNTAASTTAATISTILGTNTSYADGTILRNGANLAIQMGNLANAQEFVIEEWLTFEGNNYVTVGSLNTALATPTGFSNPQMRLVNLGGVITLNGNTTFDTVPSQTVRLGWNGGAAGFLTGNGTLIKDGQGSMELRTNNPEFTGNIVINQGRITALGQADVLGTGYLGANKTITLGSTSRQGIAELFMDSESSVHNWQIELNHDINVVYNPAQTKRIAFQTVGNGGTNLINGDIILNDNLQLYFNDGAETGGSQNFLSINGQLRDGATTSGNILFWGDDNGSANDNTNGRPYSYFVLNNNNNQWTGDAIVSANTGYDQDQTTILRLQHNQALTAANDVVMNFNSVLQAGGGSRTIGALTTSGGVGNFVGDTAGMGASSNGTTVVIENAAVTAGTLRIMQSTPGSTEVQWNAHFRDGTLNSQFFAPGASPNASAALNVVKAGNGWATLTVDNNYTGTTLVEGGILQVGRNGVGDTGAMNAGGLTSNIGTTVAGTGQIHGASVIHGQLRPGDEAGGSMGTLRFTGDLTLSATSVTTLQIQRPTYTAMNAVGYDNAAYAAWISGLTTDINYSHMLNDAVTLFQHDQLIIGGQLTATSGALISLFNNGYNPSHGDVFKLIDWSSVSGTFNIGGTAFNGGLFRTGGESGLDLELPELGGNFRWDVSQFNTAGIVVVSSPEPSRAMLLLLGLLGLMLRRRRR